MRIVLSRFEGDLSNMKALSQQGDIFFTIHSKPWDESLRESVRAAFPSYGLKRVPAGPAPSARAIREET